jgi:ribosomal protein S27AE
MAVAQGSCPSCGAPMTFGVGSSVSQVCKFCKACVVRTDRDFKNMGRVADLAMTPSPIAVGDFGELNGKQMQVLGRVQLDHGAGPWDEYYIGFADGTWGWLAYAQGNWYATWEVTPLPAHIPPWDAYALEQDIQLGTYGSWRVKEVKQGTIVSGEGELPMATTPGQERYYVDVCSVNNGFGTFDFGDGTTVPQIFLGYELPEGAIKITMQGGERPVTEVNTDHVACPNCGGQIPVLAKNRSERLGCPYCNAVSEIASKKVVEQQAAARARPDIPLGSRGMIGEQEYVVCGYVERSTVIEGEWFGWQEYLLFGQGLGFRWLVKDESSWMWINPINPADLDLREMPNMIGYGGRQFHLRNNNMARVDYVLGEFYWKVVIGETVECHDFINGQDVVASEFPGDEVIWSLSTPIPWPTIAGAFNLPLDGAGAQLQNPDAGEAGAGTKVIIIVVIIAIVLLVVLCAVCGGDGGGSGGGVFFGGGFRGGK